MLVLGQTIFLACLGGCVALDRRGLWDNHGWSYYGGRADTAVVYGFGFTALILCVLGAAALLERPPGIRTLPALLVGLALALALDLATPDTVSPLLYDAHVAASVVLFLLEFTSALWLVVHFLPTRPGKGLFALLFAGGLTAMFSQLQWIGLLGLGILVFQVSYFVILGLAVERATAAQTAVSPVASGAEAPAEIH
jgi:hypothetical protein